MERDKFHGRVKGTERQCNRNGCHEAGEFRAPNPAGRGAGFDGPGDWQWLCLDHVREFNARYDWFKNMTREEIEAAQMPLAGWAQETRAFRATAGVDQPPRWADFHDPLDAISTRFRDGISARAKVERFSSAERRALKLLGLGEDVTKRQLRARYTKLLRQYHPDHNGGDRRHEQALQHVVEAYQRLLKAAGNKA